MDGYRLFRQAAADSKLASVVARIEAGYCEHSPKGVHLLYFCDATASNKKLNDQLKIETRGEGGFVVIAPSSFLHDSTLKQYALVSGSLSSIARISPDERELLHSMIRQLHGPTLAQFSMNNGGTTLNTIAEGGRNSALTSLAGSMRRRGMSGQALAAALRAENQARCNPPLPDHEVEAIVRSVTKYPLASSPDPAAPIDWKAPGPLPAGMPVVPVLAPLQLLPPRLGDWVSDQAHRLQCPPDYPAVGLLVALSSVIGGRLCIRPKQLDNWTVVPNLWGMVIGRPSTLKTPAVAAALAPLKELEATAQAAYQADLLKYQAAQMAHELALGHTKKQATNKNGVRISAIVDGQIRLMVDGVSE